LAQCHHEDDTLLEYFMAYWYFWQFVIVHRNFVYFVVIWYILWSFGIYFVVIWYILWSFGIFCGHLVYFVVIWYIFPVLMRCTKKNLTTLVRCGILFYVSPNQTVYILCTASSIMYD
jgi:hypothetical protein